MKRISLATLLENPKMNLDKVKEVVVQAPLCFDEFQAINAIRSSYGWRGRCDYWNVVDWSNAICGEAGELAGYTKKIRRGDANPEELAKGALKEAADIIIYCLLFIEFMKCNASEVCIGKFNEVSKRPDVNFPILVEE
jgi:hypothetical protein